MIVSVTGHRDVEQEPGELLMFARLSVEQMQQHFDNLMVITGMARGWDLKVARACADLDVPFFAAVPFPGQESKWHPEDQKDYYALLPKAAHVETISRLALNESYHARNRWMVDRSDELWSFWNGQPGGTAHCTLYADGLGRIVRPLWEPWLRFRAERTY